MGQDGVDDADEREGVDELDHDSRARGRASAVAMTRPAGKLALVVPGGVHRSGTRDVIPAVLALVERLAARHELHVFALFQQEEAERWELRGAQIHAIGGSSRLAPWRALAAIAAEHRRAPFALVQSLWTGPCGWSAALAGRWLSLPVAMHVAGGELVALRDIGYGGLLGLRGRLRERWLLRRADAVTSASAPMLALIAAQGAQARRLPLGVDLAAWPPLAPRPRAPGAPLRLLHLASLNRVKDQTTLLRAVARAAAVGLPLRLDVVGIDTLGGQVQAWARTLGLSEQQVRFHGFLPQQDCRPWVEQADVLVMASRHEAGPLAVLEAAVAGVPCVGTAVGHIAEWGERGAALAVPVGDDAGLAAAILSVGNDEALRLALATRAQAIACAEDADHTAAAFQALHDELLARKGLR